MYQPIRGQDGHLVFPIGPKKTNLVEDFKILLPVKFRWILFSGFRGEVRNVSANQRPGRSSCFSDRPEKHKLCKGRWDLASCQVSLYSFQRFQRRSRKWLSQSEARAAILFSVGPKNTNLVEDVEILLPVKFRWIPFNGFRGEVENVSANQRTGRPSCFSDRPKNTNLVENVEILLPVKLKFSCFPFSSFGGEVENVSTNQRQWRPSCFSDRPEKHKLGRGCWDLASCQVWWNSVQRFQRRSRKCEKVTTDGRTTDRQTDGRRTTRDHNSAPSAQVH